MALHNKITWTKEISHCAQYSPLLPISIPVVWLSSLVMLGLQAFSVKHIKNQTYWYTMKKEYCLKLIIKFPITAVY